MTAKKKVQSNTINPLERRKKVEAAGGKGRDYRSLDDTSKSPISGKKMKKLTCGFRGPDEIPVYGLVEDRIALPIKDDEG